MNNSSHNNSRSSSSTTLTTNKHMNTVIKKRPLPPHTLRLTHCQWIDCVSSSHHISSNSQSSQQQVRYQARKVCWNASGSLLAVGCSDSVIRLWNPMSIAFDSSTAATNNPCKEVGSINTMATTGHAPLPPIIAATFHPTSDPILCSMTAGSGTLRLWDIRSSTTASSSSTNTNHIPSAAHSASSALSHCTIMTASSSSLSPLPIVVAVEWNPIQTHMISCTTHDGTVSIYDTRKFTNLTTASTSTSSTNTSTNQPTALVRKIQFPDNDRIESCIFDPVTGEYIIAGVTNRGGKQNQNHHPALSSSSSGMGYIKAYQWDASKSNHEGTQGKTEEITKSTDTQHSYEGSQPWYAYPAHAGPIYTIASSHHHRHRRNGGGGGTTTTSTTTTTTGNSYGLPKIATGGSDAVVGIWDVSTMTCTSTISSRTKFIRALAFSCPNSDTDPLLLAIATEEDVIELIDCSTGGSSTSIGCANLSNTSSIGRRSMMMPNPGMMTGAEDICFHPTIPHFLACARTNDVATPSGMSSVTLLKFTISSAMK